MSFSPPASNGGSPITSYTVTATDATDPAHGGQTATGPASPITVTGLTNGDSYTFTVAATNTVGTGPASGASNPVTPATTPGAPSEVGATAGDGQATVSFSPPASNGGSPITGYTVTATDATDPAHGGQTATGPASPITVTGLTNGDSYTFTVAATNTVGTGPASGASNPVTPATTPGAPSEVGATAGDGQATVSFSPPASNGGSPITGYTVTATDATDPAHGGQTATGPASPITVTGLTNGDSYTFTVAATNAVGTGPASGASNPVTPATTPGAPSEVGATAGDGQATVSFSPPASNGGSPITGYTVTATDATDPAHGGQTATGPASPITVTGLTNGDSYTFTVAATNAVGTGPASGASNPVTPATTPGAPSEVGATAGDGQATVSFSPPASNGGSPITGYTVTATDATDPAHGGQTATGPASPITVTGLTNGDSYTFTVAATNAVGTGPVSGASNPVVPQVPAPGRPGAPTAVAGNAAATVTVTAPTSGGTPSSYTVTAADATNPAHGGQTCTVAGAAGSCTVIGLTNGDTYTFTVTAANPGGTSPASPPSNPVIPRPALSILVASLPDGTVGVAYQATLSASGGTGTYTWSVASGSLPPGLTLSGGGTISGTPTTTGTFAFIVSVSDPVTQPLSITILPASAVATAKAPSEASTPAPALVSSAPPPATSSPTLAVTGSDVDRLVTDAWAAILAGGLIVIGSTRRRLRDRPGRGKR